MAKTKKVSDRDSQFRKSCIKLAVDKKKADHSYIPKRDEFVRETKIPRRKIIEAFGSFAEFVRLVQGEYIRSLGSSERALLSERSKKFAAEATKEECIEDLRAVQKREPLKHITRNFYRENGKYSDKSWNRYFGTFQEFRRQAGLELTRHQHALERGIAKQASVDHYREYYKTQVLPNYKKHVKPQLPGNIKRIKIISDMHDKECDEFALSVFIAECKRDQPDIIIFNGDIFDLLEFGKYSIDPRRYDIKGRFDFVRERLFRPIRKACPNAQIDFIMGNHEFRLIRLLADATPNLMILLHDVMGLNFSDVFGIDEFQINWVSKLDFGVYSKKDLNNEMKQNYQVYYDCYVACHEPDKRLMQSMSGTNGHHHKAEFQSDANLTYGPITWVQTPGLHVPDAEYLRNLSSWNVGFLDVVINIETKQVIQTIVQIHPDWAVINGILYEREEV